MNTQNESWTEDTQDISIQDKDFSFIRHFPSLLRIAGTGALLIAMYSFLVKGWENGNDIIRYLLMLGHTGIIAAIGLASGHWLKESKGARLLLTLAVVSVPANFAILGALIYSKTALLSYVVYPHLVTWSVDSLSTAVFTTVGALVVLIPATLLGFTVLARSVSKKLSILFLLSSAMLLIPVRDPQIIGILALGLTLAIIAFGRNIARGQTSLQTTEGSTALFLQLVPLSILLGRSLLLYSVDTFLLAILSGAIFVILRQSSLVLTGRSKLRITMEGLSILPAITIGLSLIGVLIDIPFFPNVVVIPLSALVSAGMIYDIAHRAQAKAKFYRLISVLVVTGAMLVNLLLHFDFSGGLLCTLTGLCLAQLGYKLHQQNLFVSGVLLFGLGGMQQLYEIGLHFDFGNWSSLTLLGIFAIVIASTIESKGPVIKARLMAMKTQFLQWDK